MGGLLELTTTLVIGALSRQELWDTSN
jgi:hypothetical protein